MRIHSRQTLRFLVGVLLAALAIYFLSRQVDWAIALAFMRNAQPFWFALAAFSVVFTNAFKSLRWRLLFPPDEPLPSARQVFGALMAGQFLNFMLPLRSGDISRAYFMGRRRGASTASAAGTIGAEKVIDLVILGLLFVLVLPYVVLPDAIGHPQRNAFIGAGVGLVMWLGVLIALPWTQQRLLPWFMERWPVLAPPLKIFRRLLDGLSALRHRHRLPRLLLFSALAWFSAIATNLLLMQSLGLSRSWLAAILVVLIIQIGVSVPLAPGQIGVFEALAVFALSLTGVSFEQALAFGILLHILVLGVPMIFGLFWLWRQT
ncbi:MAG: flippase-like domain-containing protein [Chloroflexi bacterium]|nr:flippase-like domain-containing protein [Chloroflexota bacterium]